MNESKPSPLKRRAYEILEVAAPGDRASRNFDIFILTLIFLNGLALILETIGPVKKQLGMFFSIFETVSVIIFTIEYLLRLWSCTAGEKYARPILGRIRFAITALAFIDLLAIVPFYLPLLGIDLRLMRIVRLVRFFRIAKLVRYSTAMRLFGRVLSDKKEELVTTLVVLGGLLMLASTLMYFAERGAQPQTFSSIPATMWWGIVTLTTVGYGDVFPVTTIGKTIGAGIAVLGIGMFALPTGILGAAFLEEVQKRDAAQRQEEEALKRAEEEARRAAERPLRCPHCNREIT